MAYKNQILDMAPVGVKFTVLPMLIQVANR
jgi:hypothetical protein